MLLHKEIERLKINMYSRLPHFRLAMMIDHHLHHHCHYHHHLTGGALYCQVEHHVRDKKIYFF